MEQNQVETAVDSKAKAVLQMIEDYLKLTVRMYVFEPNDKNTWAAIKSEAINYCHTLWKKGDLQGNTAEEAYDIHIGLGHTMTADDVANGLIVINAKVALNGPSAFTEICLQQQMQHN